MNKEQLYKFIKKNKGNKYKANFFPGRNIPGKLSSLWRQGYLKRQSVIYQKNRTVFAYYY